MFDDPEIDKLIIYALLGMVLVLGIAVIALGIRRNTYYVDDSGREIPPAGKKRNSAAPRPAPQPRRVEQPVLQETEAMQRPPVQPQPAPETRPLDQTLDVPWATSQNKKLLGVLVKVSIGDQVWEKEITRLPCLIGRESMSCDLVVSEPAVSRKHARFMENNGNLYIEDVSEHNGTYLNGVKLPSLGKARLHEGDRINLGRAEIIVEKFIY